MDNIEFTDPIDRIALTPPIERNEFTPTKTMKQFAAMADNLLVEAKIEFAEFLLLIER